MKKKEALEYLEQKANQGFITFPNYLAIYNDTENISEGHVKNVMVSKKKKKNGVA